MINRIVRHITTEAKMREAHCRIVVTFAMHTQDLTADDDRNTFAALTLMAAMVGGRSDV